MRVGKDVLYVTDWSKNTIPHDITGMRLLCFGRSRQESVISFWNPAETDQQKKLVQIHCKDSLTNIGRGFKSTHQNVVSLYRGQWINLSEVDFDLTARRAINLDGSLVSIYHSPDNDPRNAVPTLTLEKEQWEKLAADNGRKPFVDDPSEWSLSASYCSDLIRGSYAELVSWENSQLSKIAAVRSMDYGMTATDILIREFNERLCRHSLMDFQSLATVLSRIHRKVEMTRNTRGKNGCRPVFEAIIYD